MSDYVFGPSIIIKPRSLEQVDITIYREALGMALSDLEPMIAAAERGEVWAVNAGTRERLAMIKKAMALDV